MGAELFWRDKTFEEPAGEQGVQSIQRLEDVFGKGADLWETDEEFLAFLAAMGSSGTAGG
jgi:hypothetical protein